MHYAVLCIKKMFKYSSKKKMSTFFFSSVEIYMKDAECAESKDHDSDFSYFNFRVIVIIVLKIWSVFDEF